MTLSVRLDLRFSLLLLKHVKKHAEKHLSCLSELKQAAIWKERNLAIFEDQQ